MKYVVIFAWGYDNSLGHDLRSTCIKQSQIQDKVAALVSFWAKVGNWLPK